MTTHLNVTTHSFTDCHAQAIALAERVAQRLRVGLNQRGHALLAVSGGSTPKDFFAQLSRESLDWAHVKITLVDERWVPDTDERSNARLVKSILLQNQAAEASFVPLYTDAPTPEDGLAASTARINTLALPFDAVVLGMGDDGHTASFFPGGDHLADALDLNGKARVLPMRAPDAGEPRITLTLPTLLATESLFLLVAGDKKRDLLADVRLGLGAARDYPVHAVIAQQRVPVAVYWCP
ncbi:6-phosphogluconolactonase [Rhodanobacter sp. A1T4]|jgi:6-phosphogluconolactonase|uniref:6-phosphogluconolactonase n=1 Tax=Rhodanobacter sp. A1T4 TaxID=2723087 RepID=UPI0016188F88|nr:6-phosphogluconolactonase [Rhodanobacter sp. A1T4]MBB6247355.1 6-phosphogluconolactonase [Rhodanobacter sp. A1T4]